MSQVAVSCDNDAPPHHHSSDCLLYFFKFNANTGWLEKAEKASIAVAAIGVAVAVAVECT